LEFYQDTVCQKLQRLVQDALSYKRTRSSADADNRLDAFNSGQSSPRHKWRHTYL